MNVNKFALKYERVKNRMKLHSHIQISDNCEMTIECCKEVLSYDENQIKLLLAKNTISIVGLDMKMRNFTVDGVVITGRIQSITFDEI